MPIEPDVQFNLNILDLLKFLHPSQVLLEWQLLQLHLEGRHFHIEVFGIKFMRILSKYICFIIRELHWPSEIVEAPLV